MSVVGQKHMAYGVMKIYYRDLKVQYLNKGIENHPTLKSMLISFFANRVVNNKKLNGSGEVYAERDPERGFVNYWVKIVIGGLFTNTGVRTDNKQEKKYYQSIEKYNVPPIPDIPVDY
jgi:alpha-acetolactate decarboxylase